MTPMPAMTPSTRHRFLAAGLALAGVLGIAGTVSAAGTEREGDLSAAKARCVQAITVRHTEIAKLDSLVGSAPTLTDAHEGTIDAFLASSSSGLTALQATIEADTDPAALRAHCASIATDYRIFALRSPQVHLAIGGDREAAALARADELVPRLQAAIDAAAAAGVDVTEATATMAHLQSTIAHAESTLAGVVDTLLGYTPSDWNANHSLLDPITAAVRSVKTDITTAIADARAIIAGLKG